MQASRFHFVCYTLPDSTAVPSKTVRAVNPSLKRISAWISSVGAAAAVGDLDGDGLANDVCLVDPSSPKAEAVEQVRFPAAAAEVARFKQA